MIARHLLGISAEQNVRSAAGHVSGHGDRALAPGLGDDARFALVLLGVQNFVRNFRGFQQCRYGFGFFDGDGAHQHRLAALVIMPNAVGEGIIFLHDAIHHGGKFFFFRAVDDVGMFFTNQVAVGGDDHHIEVINFAELRRFRFGRSGHAGQFFVHAEIILKSDGGEGLVLALDFHAFFGFDGLVQAVRPAPAGHLAAGKFVHNNDLAVFIHIIHVNSVQRVRPQPLVHVMHDFNVGGVGHIAQAQQALALVEALFGESGLAVLFINGVINILNQFGNDLVDPGVFIRGFFGWSGNNQRGARFINEDGVHFVNDGEVMAALHTIGQIVLHVVAQIVETKFVVRSVGDVRAVRRAALLIIQVVDDNAYA